MLAVLRDGPLDRQELEDRLDISRATSHRFTRWLGDRGSIERVDGEFRLTVVGTAVAGAIEEFQAEVATAFLLAPVFEVASDAAPTVPLSAFADATVTSADRGDPHAPVVRYLSLAGETGTLRGFDTWSIAPTYVEEIQRLIPDGMGTELVDPVAVVGDVMESYPERRVQVCVSGTLTIHVHELLPFDLAIFDDRVGIAVRDPETPALRAFVDTDAPAVRAWAEAVFEADRAESVHLEDVTRKGLREALAAR